MKRCLIAEASEIIRRVARHFIEQAGLEVLEADTAQDALALCKQKKPDLLLLDWRLPGMSTVEVLSALRYSGLKRPTVIYWTTDNDGADIARAIAAGASHYMIKPFTRADMNETLTQVGITA